MGGFFIKFYSAREIVEELEPINPLEINVFDEKKQHNNPFMELTVRSKPGTTAIWEPGILEKKRGELLLVPPIQL